MTANVPSSARPRRPAAEGEFRAAAGPARAARLNEAIERPALFWLLVAGLAWVPLWYGSNDLIAWGINAILFPGLAIVYELSLLLRGDGHPIGIRRLAVPAALFAAVLAFIGAQNLTFASMPLLHPIWGMAADVLQRPLPASVSVDRDLTALALIRLITAASVFWLALQLCRNAARARLLVRSVATIGCLYAAYGIVAFTSQGARIPWLKIPPTGGFLSSTFINRNSFATYAGIGLVTTCGLILRLYRHEVGGSAGLWRLRMASFIETTGQAGGPLLGGAFVMLVALLLTGSRGGILATAVGLFVLGVLTFKRGTHRSAWPIEAVIFGGTIIAAVLYFFADAFVANLVERGITDTDRMVVYSITLRSILDAPLVGFGYGTFADVFPLYRDRSIAVQGVWEQAHGTYLEAFQGLGLVFGSMLVATAVLLVLRCIKGAAARQENATVPRIAASAALLVGVHALVDFSLQIQAIALTVMALLGAGVAQSDSSRLALAD